MTVLNLHFFTIRFLIQVAPFNKHAIEFGKAVSDGGLTIWGQLRRRRNNRIYRSVCGRRTCIE